MARIVNRRGLVLVLLFAPMLLWVSACGGPEVQAPPPASALLHFQHGNDALGKSDYASAAHAYRVALKMDDRPAAFHYNLGLALFHIGEFDQAVEAFDAALMRAPDAADAHYNLALAHYARYDLGAAHAHYNEYVRLAAGSPDPGQLERASGANAPGTGEAASGPGNGAPNGNANRPAQAVSGPGQRNGGTGRVTNRRNAAASMDATDNPFEGNPEWWKEALPRQ